MYNYKVSLVGYDRYDPIELCHEELFSEDGIREMYVNCIEEAYIKNLIPDYLLNENVILNKELISEDIDKYHSKIVDMMIERYGFQKIKIEFEISVHECISNDIDHESDYGEGDIKREFCRVASCFKKKILDEKMKQLKEV